MNKRPTRTTNLYSYFCLKQKNNNKKMSVAYRSKWRNTKNKHHAKRKEKKLISIAVAYEFT